MSRSERCVRRVLAIFVLAALSGGGSLVRAATVVPGGTIATDTTWTLAGSPYNVTGNVAIAGADGADGITTLTLEPGVEVRFNTSTQLQIGGTTAPTPGAIVADGNAAGGPAQIRFTSSAVTPGPGSWSGIYFRPGARASTLRNARVEYGGGSSWAGIYVSTGAGVTLTLDAIEIANSANNGLELAGAVNLALSGSTLGTSALDDIAVNNVAAITGSVTGCSLSSVRYAGNAPTLSWSGNTFTSWGARVSRIPGDDIGDLADDNTFAKVADARVEVLADTIGRDATWTVALADAYVAVGSQAIAGAAGPDGITTLTLEPGVELRFNASIQLQIGGTSVATPGAIVADGNAAGGPAQIRFTSSSATPAPGGWLGIYFRPGARASTLRNARVEYGGGSSWAGIYVSTQAGVTLTLDAIEIANNATNGLELAGATQLALSGSTLSTNGGDDIVVGNLAAITGSVTGCSLSSVRYAGSAPALAWSGNTFTSWGARVSRIPGNDIVDFAADNTFAKVPSARVEVLADTVAQDATWTTAMADAYVTTGAVSIAGTHGPDGITTLTLEPGVEMLFDGSVQLRIGGNVAGIPGALVADGTTGGGPARIRFASSSATPGPGSWTGLYFLPGARPSVLRHARIDHGGGSGWAAVYLNQAAGITVTIDDVIITQSAYYGIYQGGPATMDDISISGTGNSAIHFASDAVDLDGCNLSSGSDHDVAFGNVASLAGSIRNCSAIHSVFYGGEQPSVSWSNNAFIDWGARVSRLEPEAVGDLLADNTFALVPLARVELTSGTVASDAAWSLGLGNPYVVLGSIDVQGASGPDGITTLTLEPGLEMLCNPNVQFQIGGTSVATPGALVADGTAGGGPARIRFASSSATPGPGSWTGLYFRPGARSSVLRHARVDHGGGGSWAAIYLNQATGNAVAIDDVIVTESGYYGIYQGGPATMDDVYVTGAESNAIYFSSDTVDVDGCGLDSSSNYDVEFANAASLAGSIRNCTAIHSVFYAGEQPSVTWTDNAFIDWGARVSRLEPEAVGDLLADNTFAVAPAAQIELTAGTVETDASWSTALGNPYVAQGRITVEGSSGGDGVTTLTLSPGLELRFAPNVQFQIGGTSVATPGALVADGDAAGGPATILLTSSVAIPSPGSWTGLYFRSGARASTLRNARIEYGGSSGWAAIYDQHNTGTLTLDGVEIEGSANHGLVLAGAGVAVTGASLDGNGSHDIHAQGTATLTGTIEGSTLRSVFYGGDSPSLEWSGNSFQNWGALTSRVPAEVVGPLAAQNSFLAVPGAVLEVIGGTLASDATWTDELGPLRMLGSLTVRGTAGPDSLTTLTLDRGATLLFPQSGSLFVGGNSGEPGGLATTGAAGGPLVNLGSSLGSPATGSWNGVDVRTTGRVALADVQIRYASTALGVRGTIDQLERFVVNRSGLGLDLVNATVTPVLDLLTLRNTSTAVRAQGTNATIRGSNIEGSTWGVQNLSPATHCIDARMSFWGAPDGPSGAAPASGCETAQATGMGSPITAGVRFAMFVAQPTDDLDGIDCDDGDGFNDPCSGGLVADCDDNCCAVANLSQSDGDGDGVGDACDGNPVLRVSSDPLDLPDFVAVQDAVDATFQSGSTIEIFPGLGPYAESVSLDREQVFNFVALEEPSGDPVIVDGMSGPAFWAVSKVGVAPITFSGLTLRGAQGIRALVDTSSRALTFDGTTGEALKLDGGVHSTLDSRFDPPFAIGADVGAGASLTLERCSVVGASDAGVRVAGVAKLRSTLVAGGLGGDGLRLAATGNAQVLHATIADNTGVGIDSTAGGVLDVVDSIVYGNAAGDLVPAQCTPVRWSDVGSPDCSGGGDNLSADPLLGLDYRPLGGSPCLEHGPDPATFTGEPPFDLDGAPRLLDHDGDGLAHADCGAFETANPAPVPGEVQNLIWTFDFHMEWDVEPSAVEYHVYRDTLANLSFNSFGVCADGIDGDRTDTRLDDLAEPLPGQVYVYLVTAEAGDGTEGSLGFATVAERSNFAANRCP